MNKTERTMIDDVNDFIASIYDNLYPNGENTENLSITIHVPKKWMENFSALFIHKYPPIKRVGRPRKTHSYLCPSGEVFFKVI